jgi:hypothetical protein
LLFAGSFAAVGELLPHEPTAVLRWSVLAAAAGLFCWYGALLIRAVPLTIEISIRKQHWIQACTHTAIFVYWSTWWPLVSAWAPLILVQLLFAYSVDMLLVWSRRRTYTLGFGPFPIIGSINLFLWFKPDWFSLQLAMVAMGILAKEFIRWEKDGRRTHVFNPSSFPLAIFSLGLLATHSTDITWGYDVATLLDVPYMYVVIFLVSLPGQFFFGVTTMTMSAVTTMFLFSAGYYHVTGMYYFPDTFIPIAVFLGMHLLFTDPSTAPRTDGGRIAFGVLYATSVILLFAVLERLGMPSFYDKLLGVPLLNLMIQSIDRAANARVMARLDPSSLFAGLRGRQKNLAMMSIWCCGFAGFGALHVNLPKANGTTALHAAVEDDRLAAVRLLLLVGADANAVDGFGKTPVSLAAMDGNGRVLKALIGAGGNPNASAANGLTMLMLAARTSTAATQALLDGGAVVNARDPNTGETALMWAARARNAETVGRLIRAGADVNARDNEGRTALVIATSNGDKALVQLLLDGGADLNLPIKAGV